MKCKQQYLEQNTKHTSLRFLCSLIKFLVMSLVYSNTLVPKTNLYQRLTMYTDTLSACFRNILIQLLINKVFSRFLIAVLFDFYSNTSDHTFLHFLLFIALQHFSKK